MLSGQFRSAFSTLLRMHGGTIIIHKNFGAPSHSSVEVQGMKNHEKGDRSRVMFQFLDRIDIQAGDVLQQRGSSDYWVVFDTEDTMIGGSFVHFEAKVHKKGINPQENVPSGVVIQGPNYGGIQVNSNQSVQNITQQSSEIILPVTKLMELLKNDSIDDISRGEAEAALHRITDLVSKEASPRVTTLLKEKLDIVSGTFSVAKELAVLAAPHIGSIARLITGA